MRKLVLFLFVACALPVLAQPKGENGKRKEKIEALHVEYINKNLELTDAEKEKFWPIYNEMTTKMKDSRKESMKLKKELKDGLDSMKDEEIKTKMEAILQNEQSELNLKKEYGPKIASTIGYKKSVKLVSLEREFRQELKKELQKRKGEEGPKGTKGPQGPGGPHE